MDLQTLQHTAVQAFAHAPDMQALELARVQYMGQKGEITGLLKELGKLPPDERKARGAELNAVREAAQAAWQTRKDALELAEMNAKLAIEAVDVTLPADFAGLAALGQGVGQGVGKIHPLTAAMEEIAAALKTLGFVHAHGPEVETDEYNFTKLNLPPEHPARQDQDTFYLQKGGIRHVLRTQTSNVQIHTLEAHKPPFRVMGIGRVYRRDYDLTHTPQFHQVEGMAVDAGITMGDMRGVLSEFLRLFFGKDMKTRLRPHYFPFTEPSAELDMACIFCEGKGCRVCKHSGWIELLGCGMVHRNVLAVGGVDIANHTGFAFGAGVERLAMLKYGISDLRLFYESHGAFLRTFGKVPVAAV